MISIHTNLRSANLARQAEWEAKAAASNGTLTPKLDGMFSAVELAGETGEAIEALVDVLIASLAANDITTKLGRICNIAKKLERARLGYAVGGASKATVADLADELADLVICADLLAIKFNIDLEQAIGDKFDATSIKIGLTTRLMIKND